MPQFTVPLAGGGSMTVNASSAEAARGNVGAAAAQPSSSGGGGGGGGGSAPAPAASSSSAPAGTYYSSVSGYQTLPTMTTQLANAGYNGPTDPASIVAAYARTTGGTVTPGGSAPAPSPTGAAPPTTTDTSGLAKFAAETSGVTQAQLAQQKAEFDAQLQFAKDQMTQLGLPQLAINQALAALQQKAFDLQVGQTMGTYQGAPTEAAKEFQATLQQQMQQFEQSFGLSQGQLTGMYQGAPTEAAKEFQANLGLQQGQLGQQYLATASQLQGPQNTFQLSNYLRGAQGNQAVPTYLQSLASNIGMPMFQGAGSTAPTPQSAAGLAGQLGGQQSATPGWDYGQTLNSIQRIMQQGAQSLRPGALENLTPDELQALGSGIGAAGGSLPSFLQQYQSSRLGQSVPTGVPVLA